MNTVLTVHNIMQTKQAGTVVFISEDKDGKPVPGSAKVVVQFPNAEGAAAYVHGASYEITITKKTD